MVSLTTTLVLPVVLSTTSFTDASTTTPSLEADPVPAWAPAARPTRAREAAVRAAIVRLVRFMGALLTLFAGSDAGRGLPASCHLASQVANAGVLRGVSADVTVPP